MTTKIENRQFRLVDPVPVYLGSKIRVLVDELNNFEPWFVAVDLCRAIGVNPAQSYNILKKLDARDKITNSIRDSKTRPMSCVSEPGFYELVLGSRKPGAVAFKRWVCSAVLPSIRRHGSYQALADDDNNPVDIPEVMVEMVNLTKKLPSGDVSECATRIHVWEYCEVFGYDFNKHHRSRLGAIARRLLHTYDLPVLKTWKPGLCKNHKWQDENHGISGTYPIAILDMAYQEFLNGRRD